MTYRLGEEDRWAELERSTALRSPAALAAKVGAWAAARLAHEPRRRAHNPWTHPGRAASCDRGFDPKNLDPVLASASADARAVDVHLFVLGALR